MGQSSKRPRPERTLNSSSGGGGNSNSRKNACYSPDRGRGPSLLLLPSSCCETQCAQKKISPAPRDAHACWTQTTTLLSCRCILFFGGVAEVEGSKVENHVIERKRDIDSLQIPFGTKCCSSLSLSKRKRAGGKWRGEPSKQPQRTQSVFPIFDKLFLQTRKTTLQECL